MPIRSSHRSRRPHKPHDTPATTARDLVCRVLTAQAARFPEIEALELDTAALPEIERSLAHALYDAAIRRWLTLEFLVSAHLRQPFRELEPGLQAALLVGAAQLVLFDRIPAHAAIDETVEWAKRRIRPGAGNMVNAVLRRLAERVGEADDWLDPHSIPLSASRSRAIADLGLPEDKLAALSVATSMPETVLRRWRRQMSYDEARNACLHALSRPPTILNTRHLASPLPDGSTVPHSVEGHAVWIGTHDALAVLLETRRDVWAQDPASSGAVRSVADLRPRLIADLCAGQGTKTRQLAAEFPEAGIIATDVDRARYATLARTFEGHARVSVVPPQQAIRELSGRADLVLLDVPCSNTGVLGRRVEARYRATPAAIDRLTDIQRQLIADSIPLLSPRGSVLYATCSLEHAENDAIAVWAVQWHGMARSRERRVTPASSGGSVGSVDGAYSVVLGRG